MPLALWLWLPLPPVTLNPNRAPRRVAERIARDRDKATYLLSVKAFAQDAARREGWTAPAMCELGFTFVFCGRAAWDADNCIAAFKAGQDALIAAGVIAGDDFRHCRLGGVRVEWHARRCHCQGGSGIELTISEVAECRSTFSR